MWGVRWMAAEAAKARMFISLAADGRIVMWSLVKDKLQHEVGGPLHGMSVSYFFRHLQLLNL